MKEEQKKELFSMSDIRRMTEEFDVIKFYENYQDYLAIMMITPAQVVAVYWKSYEILGHPDVIDDFCDLLTKNGEKSIFSISFVNEEGLAKTFFMKERKSEKKATTKMKKVVELIYNLLFVSNNKFDVEHNELNDVFPSTNNLDYEENASYNTIIGIPIDEYIEKLNKQTQYYSINDSKNDER